MICYMILSNCSSTSQHNRTVKEKIHLGVASQRDCEYSDEVVSGKPSMARI